MEKFDFYKLIENRRSIRNYDPKKGVPKSVLERILNAGRVAPTAGNRQPVSFRVVQDPQILKKVSRCYPTPWFVKAPTILVLSGKRSDAWTRSYDGFNSLEIDLAIIMDHMILAAEFEGVSSCWIIAFDKKIVSEELDLNPEDEILCMTPLGYPEKRFLKPGMPKRKKLEEIVKYY